jgi:PAT family beta-lactamase induction signal transducer AmpG
VFLAISEPSISTFAVVISADNLSGGFATSAFIAYLSSMTNKAYSATQYALFSSLMTLPAKFIGGFSGIVVDAAGYAYFFLYAGLLGIPALLLIIYILHQHDAS